MQCPAPVIYRAEVLLQRKPHTIPLLFERQEPVRGFPRVPPDPPKGEAMSSRPYRVREEGWLTCHVRLAAIVIAVCSTALVAVKSWPY